MVGKPCATLVEQPTNKLCAVGLAMLNDMPVMVDILDAKSALDSDANFTGERKRIFKVIVVEFIPVRFADKHRSYCHQSVQLKPVQSIASGSTTLITR